MADNEDKMEAVRDGDSTVPSVDASKHASDSKDTRKTVFAAQQSTHRHGHPLFSSIAATEQGSADAPSPQLMGPILRRKKVVSMPLGAGGDFFFSDDQGGPHRQLEMRLHHHARHREKQMSLGHRGGGGGFLVNGDDIAGSIPREKQLSSEGMSGRRKRQTTPPSNVVAARNRTKQGSFMDSLVRRKQISLDLLGPNDFFSVPISDEEEKHAAESTTSALGEFLVVPEDGIEDNEVVQVQQQAETKLFLPLRFAPPMIAGQERSRAKGGGHTGGHGPITEDKHGPSMFVTTVPLPEVVNETLEVLKRQSRHRETLKLQLSALQNKIDESEQDPEKKDFLLSVSQQILETQSTMEEEQEELLAKLDTEQKQFSAIHRSDAQGSTTGYMPAKSDESKHMDETSFVEEDDGIVRADKCDKIKAAVIFVIMLAFTTVVCSWDTHINSESHIYSPVGLACVTDCMGNLDTRDFFHGHNHFESGELIELIMHMDPNPDAVDAYALVEIVGETSGAVKSIAEIGPVDHEDRVTFEKSINVDFADPGEHHFINVKSKAFNIQLSFTLVGEVRTPLAENSVAVAAVIMVVVYLFILLEVIHRTLIAIFGSMVALLFVFIMSGGSTDSIEQIMLSMEWSTLGLLFGMMLLVGELSHTGIFEWCTVRLLMASRGSFNLLMVLLGVLTAVASAFLDNVTTMLLVAPVTIDMCSILGVDPRPYLIGEVLLSNVGGTATLIGDPPNIIIGTSFEEIDFVGFIVNVLPAIFIIVLPVTVLLVLWIYRYYFSTSKMKELDTDNLLKTYPIYDQPRLMIAGTVTGFVILIFFLHSVHHKDTAWIALFGAFITISFTNPHDVQDALRNHVEWDTLLFFAGLFVLVEACAHMGLLEAIGSGLASYIEAQPDESQLSIAITLVIWVSAFVSAFLDNIPYTATMIPVVQIMADKLDTLDLATMAWALSFGACLGGNGTLLGASANIVTAGISKNKGFQISFLNFLYPGMLVMITSVTIANLYMLVRYVWI